MIHITATPKDTMLKPWDDQPKATLELSIHSGHNHYDVNRIFKTVIHCTIYSWIACWEILNCVWTSIYVASFPGRLPLCFLDRIHDLWTTWGSRFSGHFKGRQENGVEMTWNYAILNGMVKLTMQTVVVHDLISTILCMVILLTCGWSLLPYEYPLCRYPPCWGHPVCQRCTCSSPKIHTGWSPDEASSMLLASETAYSLSAQFHHGSSFHIWSSHVWWHGRVGLHRMQCHFLWWCIKHLVHSWSYWY